MRFGMSRHVTCVTRCKEWYSMTHTAAGAQRAHSTSHLVHCNIVPRQATPFINPTYTNSIQNPELKYTVTDRYVTPSQACHQQPHHSEDTRTNALNALTHGHGKGGRKE